MMAQIGNFVLGKNFPFHPAEREHRIKASESGYPPAKKLVQPGLARFVKSMRIITDAGREELKESESAEQ
jgi:hypothetical protein